jgi:hypothetical protein
MTMGEDIDKSEWIDDKTEWIDKAAVRIAAAACTPKDITLAPWHAERRVKLAEAAFAMAEALYAEKLKRQEEPAESE